jgi:hypothetical protein
MNPRERQVRAARRLVPDAQLIAFLRAVRGSTDLFAVKLVNGDLDSGKSLDEIFYTRMEYGYSLSVYMVAVSGFLVSFGCELGSTEEDGGEWQVSFVGDSVNSVQAESFWIS